VLKILGALVGMVLLVWAVMMSWYNHEPVVVDPLKHYVAHKRTQKQALPPGYETTEVLIESVTLLLTKRGGYLADDVYPPWVFLDNVPHWEFGVLTAVRDLNQSLLDDFSRSGASSAEDPDLKQAVALFQTDYKRSEQPNAASQFEKGIAALKAYQKRLSPGSGTPAHFYATAENLTAWLAVVEKRLSSLSRSLAVSSGQDRINTELADTASEDAGKPTPTVLDSPWAYFDDQFYTARGTAWAMVMYLRGMEVDFAEVLRANNAMDALRQVIRELEYALAPLEAPMLRNGPQYGLLANQPLILANYLSLASYAVKDLSLHLQADDGS